MRHFKILLALLMLSSVLKAQVSVVPTIKHLTSTGTPNAGTITLNVSGGTSPYSYTWTPGPSYTKDITNKAKNTYVVKVKDSSPTTTSYTYNIGYKADWDQMYGCISRNDSLISSGTHNWSQAITKNNLAASTAGWIEYILKGTGETKVFGVLDSLSPLPYNIGDIDYGYYYDGNLYEIIYGSLTNIVWGGYPEGTALRVERSGTTVKFVVNGVTTHTLTDASAAAKIWKAKGMIAGGVAGASIVNMGCSFVTKGSVTFKNYSNLVPYISHCSGVGVNNGSVRIKPLKAASYTYTWQPGAVTSATISSKAAGSYSVDAKDAINTITPKLYNIGYKVKWDQPYSCLERNDSLITTGLAEWGNAISKNTLAGSTNGWFEYVLSGMDQYKIIGFTDSLSPHAYDIYDIDYGFYYAQGILYSFGKVSGFYPIASNINEGTVLRVERRGDTIESKVNGISTSYVVDPSDAAKAWKIKGIVYGALNSSLANVGCSFYQQGATEFSNYTRLLPTITHASDQFTNNGSVTVTPLQAGVYSYTWQPGVSTGFAISSKTPGTYDVKVKDALDHTNTISYNIGYKVKWDQMNGCELKHDTLVNNLEYSMGRAISKNTLLGGTDGWVEYVLKDLDQIKIFGFLDSLSPVIEETNDMDYGFSYIGNDNGRLYTITNSITSSALASNLPEGTILRIERKGDSIFYKINGYILASYKDSLAVQKNWKIKANVHSYNIASMINVGCSFYQEGYTDFPNYHMLNPTIVHASTTGANNGSIKVEEIHSPGLNYVWSKGWVVSNTYPNAVAGVYKVTSEDSLHQANNNYYNIGYKTYWDSLHGSVVRGDTLETNSLYSWGRGLSKNELPANTDGWFEYVLKDLSTFKIMGFLDNMSADPEDIFDIDYGFNYDAVYHTLYTFCKGEYGYIAGPPLEGTILRVERISDTIKLKMNGVIVATFVDTLDARKPWRIKGIVHGWPNTRLVNIGCSFSYSASLAVLPEITNYTDEQNQGEINLNVTGGVPNYNMVWNGMSLPSNHNYYLELDSAFGGPIDTLTLYPKLDTLRRNQSLTHIQSAIYNNTIIDRDNNAIHATTLVGNNFGWLTSGVSTNTCVIPPDTASNFLVFYGGGQTLTKTDPGTSFKHAVSDCIISAAQREFYMELSTVNDMEESAVGLKLSDTLNTDSLNDIMRNTMIHFKGGGTHAMDIYYNNNLVYTGTYNAADPIGILLDPKTNSIVYYRNFTPVWTQTAVPNTFFTEAYQFKALIRTPGPQLTNIIIVGQIQHIRGMNVTATDVTCATPNSGSISFSGYNSIPKEKLCNYTVTGPAGYSVTGSTGSGVLTGLSAGVYTISIQVRTNSCSGSLLSPIVQTVSIAYMPDWINQAPFGSTNVNLTDRSFNTTASPSSWSGGASSDNMLDASEAGWAEFKPFFSLPNLSTRALMFGLNNQDLGTATSDNDHAFYVSYQLQAMPIGIGSGSSQSVGPYMATVYSLGNIVTINNISPTDILKVKKVPVNAGLSMKLEFYKNDVFIVSNPVVLPATEMVADISVSRNGIYINKPRISFGCDKTIPYYFVLKKTMDAGYYTSYRKSIYFTFEEEYYDPSQGLANSLSYKIVTDNNIPVTSPPGLVEAIGDNRFTIDLSAVTGMTQGEFYRIAITNKKNEVFYARFRY